MGEELWVWTTFGLGTERLIALGSRACPSSASEYLTHSLHHYCFLLLILLR